MAKLGEATAAVIDELRADLRPRLEAAATLEAAAQRLTDALYEKFSASLALVRVFATIPKSDLPADIRAFAERLAASKGVGGLFTAETPVLSLLGTRGRDSAWNDRRKSTGHVGIPLVSSAFVDSVPMLSRLLQEIGLDLKWFDAAEAGSLAKASGRIAGTFFVEDALTVKNARGQHVIAAQEFVRAQGVKSVLGFGGGYVMSKNIVTTILFTTEKLPNEVAKLLAPLASDFKSATTKIATHKKLFEAK